MSRHLDLYNHRCQIIATTADLEVRNTSRGSVLRLEDEGHLNSSEVHNICFIQGIFSGLHPKIVPVAIVVSVVLVIVTIIILVNYHGFNAEVILIIS